VRTIILVIKRKLQWCKNNREKCQSKR